MQKLHALDGRRFEGAWAGELSPHGPSGEGTVQRAHCIYTGRLVNGRPEGEGEEKFGADGYSCSGTFRGGCLHGPSCTVRSSSGWERKGQFRFGQPSGRSVLHVQSGAKLFHDQLQAAHRVVATPPRHRGTGAFLAWLLLHWAP